MFTTLHSEDTEYSADSVEWLTHDDAATGFFACGTYQVVQEEGDPAAEISAKRPRKGLVYLYQFKKENCHLERLQFIETSAILDMKWLPAWSRSRSTLFTSFSRMRSNVF